MSEFVKKPNAKTTFTMDELEHLDRCEDDPIYFIETFIKVQHPKKGSVPLILYDFQREMVAAFHKYNRIVGLTARQMGKTTTASAYLLWLAMFREDTKVLVVANKLKSALEIMERVRYAYEECPDYIKCGTKEYNKTSITFDNGSKIEAVATTPDAGRGKSITLLYLDEFAFVPHQMAIDFWTAVQPVLSEGGGCIVTSTPRTDEDQFAQIWKGANVTTDEFGNDLGKETGENGFFPIKVEWFKHPDRDEEWAAPYKASLGKARFAQEFECLSEDTIVEVSDGEKVYEMTLRELYTHLDAKDSEIGA